MTSLGLDRRTGAQLRDWAHVLQSIEDIITTSPETRTILREYGSDLPELVDRPMTDSNVMRLFVAIGLALSRWEPRFRIARVDVVRVNADGEVGLRLWGDYLPNGHKGDDTVAFDRDTVIALGRAGA
jgi:phage baseplate assembly protein W